MTPINLMADLARQNVRLWAEDGQLHFDAPKGIVTEDVLAKLRQNKAGVLKCLAEKTTSGFYADFDNPEIIRQLDTRHPDEERFPEFATALRLGTLVLCRRCKHYKGVHAQDLGWCLRCEVETAPDVVSTCPQFERNDE